MIVKSALLVVAGYLVGSIPTACQTAARIAA